MEDWESMIHFAIHLIQNSSNYRTSNILDQRIMILNLDHANELLMKAFLIREGYIINEINRNKIKEGIKKKTQLKTLIHKDKTIDYVDCLNIISKILNLDSHKKERLLKFHQIRNEIQHRSTDLPISKEEEIIRFYPYFKELYTQMFPDFADAFPEVF